ncbi:MAG: hypothetical protein QXO22_04315 [Thermosphaera sp.]
MPRVFEGLIRSIVVIVLSIALVSGSAIVIYWLLYAIDVIDTVSMSVSGLPARDRTVSTAMNPFLAGTAYVVPLVPVGVLLVYLIYRSRR